MKNTQLRTEHNQNKYMSKLRSTWTDNEWYQDTVGLR